MDNASQQPDPQPTDPATEQAVKAAIARALPKERAPSALRQRVLMAIATEPVAATRRSEPYTPGWRGFVNRIPASLAAAAAVLVIVSVYWINRPVRPVTHDTSIPATLASNMVQRHDACGLDHDHQMPNVAIADTEVLRDLLTKKISHAAVVTTLDTGWTYDGGKFCTIGKIIAAHLMFHEDDQELSILTFNAPAGTETGPYEAQVDASHAIAGYVHDDAMTCVVISGPLGKDLTEARRVRQLVSDQCGGPKFAVCPPSMDEPVPMSAASR